MNDISENLTDLIQFVLVETSHPGNIGAVARAIKTMGFSKLALVNPRLFPDAEATSRASGANDVLEQAVVISTLDEALSDSEIIIGTSVRDRQITWPTFTPKETAQKIADRFTSNASGKVSIMFGRERTGLENDELDKASWQVRIPANQEYNSLNLASAAQIIAYELRCKLFDHKQVKSELNQQSKLQQRQRLATHEEMQSYYSHLESVLLRLEFIKVNPPTKLLRKISRLYNRADVSFEELQILRGILTSIDKKLDLL